MTLSDAPNEDTRVSQVIDTANPRQWVKDALATCAVSYMRCSGDGQVLGDTWDRQRETITKYAEANKLGIMREFRDEGVSGKTELSNREGLSSCIDFVQLNGIGLVIVEDSTRLARDLVVSEVIVMQFQKIGVRVVAASGSVDLTEGNASNPTAKLIRQILAAVSEFERACITLKLNGARKRIRDAGGKAEGVYPYGEDPKRPEEAPVLSAMLVMRGQGMTNEKIALALNLRGNRGRQGGEWHTATVAKILRRHP